MPKLTPSARLREAFQQTRSPWIIHEPAAIAQSLAQIAEELPSATILVADDSTAAETLFRDLRFFLPLYQNSSSTVNTSFFPAWEISPYSRLMPSLSVRAQRLNVAHQLKFPGSDKQLVVTYPAALAQATISQERLERSTVSLNVGTNLGPEKLISVLNDLGYQQVDVVEDPGTYGRRGGIVDIFPTTLRWPVRLEYFGDEIESIRVFSPTDQRTVKDAAPLSLPLRIGSLREIDTSPENLEATRLRIREWCDDKDLPRAARERVLSLLADGVVTPEMDYLIPFFNHRPTYLWNHLTVNNAAIFWVDRGSAIAQLEKQQEKLQAQFLAAMEAETLAAEPEKLSLPAEELLDLLKSIGRTFRIEPLEVLSKENTNPFRVAIEKNPIFRQKTKEKSKPSARAELGPALEYMQKYFQEGYTGVFTAGSQAQLDRFFFLLTQQGIPSVMISDEAAVLKPPGPGTMALMKGSISHGFRDPESKTIFVNEDEIFGKHKPSRDPRVQDSLAKSRTATSLDDLKPGDLLVHLQHGIGKYVGLVRLKSGGLVGDYVALEYAGADKLYVPVYRLETVQKYIGSGGENPQVDKLGAQHFAEAKARARVAAREIALELLNIYARRAASEGHSFSEPGEEFKAFEAAFPYDETPDQQRAIEDSIADMTDTRLMDRLVCGDVGYGKTEVAMRAAYLAALDGKQVAVLVPTTVLAEQHLQSFRSRFADTAVKIESLSRFRTSKEIKETVQKLKDGAVDIVIGTHRLLSKDVEFKNLGLLIIDEEQRFGVEHKEKLKKFRVNTDVLTLTATPIPRTLHFAMLGIRDISIIQTPPADRHAIRTVVAEFDREVIRDAIETEMQRGGQVFFIHNRVHNIGTILRTINEVVPHAKVGVAHGQMPERQLESVMVDFYQKKFDILLATAIIENGLDVPNANTIIVNRADTFGLSQLYQIRGRVGRSQTRASAYLLIPADGTVTDDAKERLQALQRHVELGSGFAISSYDLELRGAGDILGDAQSGHVTDIGYDLYMEMLAEEIARLRGEEPKEAEDVEISSSIPAYIPDEYIEDTKTRLSVYKRFSAFTSEEEIDRGQEELQDRFGNLPKEAGELLSLLKVKVLLRRFGFRSIKIAPEQLVLEAGKDPKVDVTRLLKLIQREPKVFALGSDSKLIYRTKVDTIAEAHIKLREFIEALHRN